MKKTLPIMLMFLIILTSVASAQDNWEATCIGDVLIENMTVTVGDDTIIPITKNRTCPFGCNNETGRCNPGYPSPQENLMIVGGLICVAALLLFLGMKLKEKHWVMQYFFMFIALYLILTGIYFIFNLQTLSWTQVSDIMTTNYTAILYTVILFLFYFLLQIIINATRHMTGGKKE